MYTTPEAAREALLKRRREQSRHAARNRMRYTPPVIDMTAIEDGDSAVVDNDSTSDESDGEEDETIYIGPIHWLLNKPYYYGKARWETQATDPTAGDDAEEYLVQ